VELVEGMERVEDAFIGVGEVELVSAVIVEEESVGLGMEFGVDVVGVDAVGRRERAADEHRRSIANKAGDKGIFKAGSAGVDEGCVDAVAEILRRIDEGAIKVEDEQPESLDRDRVKDVDHGSSVTRDQWTVGQRTSERVKQWTVGSESARQ
jgi:hypothetical protein